MWNALLLKGKPSKLWRGNLLVRSYFKSESFRRTLKTSTNFELLRVAPPFSRTRRDFSKDSKDKVDGESPGNTLGDEAFPESKKNIEHTRAIIAKYKKQEALHEYDDEDTTLERVNIEFVTQKGEVIRTTGVVGKSVMAAGRKANVVEGFCDGSILCMTCHVYVSDKVFALESEFRRLETDLLNTHWYHRPNSRLGCQLIVTKEMEGEKFELPRPKVEFEKD